MGASIGSTIAPVGGTIAGGIAGAAIGGTAAALATDWVIREQTEISRWNNP